MHVVPAGTRIRDASTPSSRQFETPRATAVGRARHPDAARRRTRAPIGDPRATGWRAGSSRQPNGDGKRGPAVAIAWRRPVHKSKFHGAYSGPPGRRPPGVGQDAALLELGDEVARVSQGPAPTTPSSPPCKPPRARRVRGSSSLCGNQIYGVDLHAIDATHARRRGAGPKHGLIP